MTPVDIIIPVYRGLKQTRACIESVLAAKNQCVHEVIVINDASPEPEIAAYLAALGGKIILHTNASNLGFVKTCNRAFALHPDRDVLLLNSDTVVANNWLDRMVRAAGTQPNIASVTPFSNNATICSYPRIGEANPMPEGLSVAELDQLFAEHNAGEVVEIPTAVGFCMLVRRAAIEAVGVFDDTAFGRGYGEENDWCLRAAAAGFRHLLAADVFVFHEGGVSFSDESDNGKINAQKIIDARYPTYRNEIGDFFARDPLRPLRRGVDLARLTASSKPCVLMVTHNWGGGTEQHVLDLAELIASDANVLLMKPYGAHSLTITWVSGHENREEFAAVFPATEFHESLVPFLQDARIDRVHLHHVQGHAPEVLHLAGALRVPLDVTLHDYFPVTPYYHLQHGGVVPPGSADHAWGWSIEEWRVAMEAFLTRADRVIAPSRDLADRVGKYYPNLKISVWPHPERTPPLVVPAKVLVLGGLTRGKGLEVIRDCAKDARNRGLPLRFRLLGHTEYSVATYPESSLSISGSYAHADLDTLIALERADAFIFPSQTPESYSFTLSAAIRAGLPIVAARLGSFPERLRDITTATLVDWSAPPTAWNDALLAVVQAKRLGGEWRQSMVAESADYREKYMAALVRKGAMRTMKALPTRRYFPSKELPRDRELTLAELYEVGVVCGLASARAELAKRIGQFDTQMQAARDAADLAHEAAKLAGRHSDENALRFQAAHAAFEERLAQAVQQQERKTSLYRDAYQQLLDSTTWRATAPIRGAAQGVKNLVRWVAAQRQRLRLLPLYFGAAVQIVRQQGLVALYRRVGARLHRSVALPTLSIAPFTVETKLTPLVLPSSERPRWTVIVPVYGQHELTFTCLKSIAETCAGAEVEVIVVDDCSPELVSEALTMVSGAVFMRNEDNLGFLQTCNEAARQARGEFVVLLNNDTVVRGDWLKAMTQVFMDDAKTGLVGVKLLFANGTLQEAGGIVWNDGSASNYGRGQDPRRPEFNYRRDVDYCSGACIMLRKSLWQELEGFDVRYAPAYYEDTDLAFRVRAAGYRVVYQPHAEVIHFEGQTSGTDVTQGTKRFQVINQQKFLDRWRDTLAPHRAHGVATHLERDRLARRRILVIDTCIVMPDRDSGSLRMYEMLKLMRELGCRVSFIANNGQHPEDYARLTQSLGVEVLYAPFVSSPKAAIESLGADFNVVIVSRAPVAIAHIDTIKKHMPQAKVIFDTVDLHYLRQQREAELAQSATAKAAADALKPLELGVVVTADVTLVVSPVERAILERETPKSQVRILTNIHHASPGSLPHGDRSGVMFIGGFRHMPNVDAVIWYATEILPLLRAGGSSIRTTVVGSDVPERILKFAAADFVIVGYVPDVEPLFNAARVAVAPLRYGAGVKGKVNLPMQYGVPVVATSCAVEGMSLTAGTDVLVADDAFAFADAVRRAHSDATLWAQLRAGGLANIERCFSRNRARAVLQEVLDL